MISQSLKRGESDTWPSKYRFFNISRRIIKNKYLDVEKYMCKNTRKYKVYVVFIVLMKTKDFSKHITRK